MSAPLLAIAGAAILLFAWAGPLPGLVPGSFAAHMMLHMTVVGIGAPVLAYGLAPYLQVPGAHRNVLRQRSPRGVPGGEQPWLVLPIAASLLDLVVVWLWHVPALHHASRIEPLALALEQFSFAAVALLVWIVALTGPPLAGALTLFFTSMHMTLLGALLGLAPRVIYDGHGGDAWLGLTPLADQQAGGVIMLAIGGVIYLGGGLALTARVLKQPARP